MKFLFITSTNLATNPRLVKELSLCKVNNNECTVIYFRLNNWSDKLSLELEEIYPHFNFIKLDASRSSYISWLLFSLIEKGLKMMPITFLPIHLLAISISKRTLSLLNVISRIDDKYDWVIAHNPAAFYPAFQFAKRKGSKLGIDIEDYHPGETNSAKESNRILKIMQYILPKADYCSFAAPLIKVEVEKNVLNDGKPWVTIINGFSSSEFINPITLKNDKLKLVWFSQNITPGRGLEKLIPIVNELAENIELHLIGDLTTTNRDTLIPNEKGIVIHSPVSQLQLHKMLAQFDVGLAFDPAINKNRELAITNKIIAYAQAGLYIVCVSTPGQQQFLNSSELKYNIVKYDGAQIRECIIELVKLKISNEIYNELQFKKGNIYSWEILSKPLELIWLK